MIEKFLGRNWHKAVNKAQLVITGKVEKYDEHYFGEGVGGATLILIKSEDKIPMEQIYDFFDVCYRGETLTLVLKKTPKISILLCLDHLMMIYIKEVFVELYNYFKKIDRVSKECQLSFGILTGLESTLRHLHEMGFNQRKSELKKATNSFVFAMNNLSEFLSIVSVEMLNNASKDISDIDRDFNLDKFLSILPLIYENIKTNYDEFIER